VGGNFVEGEWWGTGIKEGWGKGATRRVNYRYKNGAEKKTQQKDKIPGVPVRRKETLWWRFRKFEAERRGGA